jgi:hypothetical protein
MGIGGAYGQTYTKDSAGLPKLSEQIWTDGVEMRTVPGPGTFLQLQNHHGQDPVTGGYKAEQIKELESTVRTYEQAITPRSANVNVAAAQQQESTDILARMEKDGFFNSAEMRQITKVVQEKMDYGRLQRDIRTGANKGWKRYDGTMDEYMTEHGPPMPSQAQASAIADNAARVQTVAQQRKQVLIPEVSGAGGAETSAPDDARIAQILGRLSVINQQTGGSPGQDMLLEEERSRLHSEARGIRGRQVRSSVSDFFSNITFETGPKLGEPWYPEEK